MATVPDAFGDNEEQLQQEREVRAQALTAQRRELEHDYFEVFSTPAGKRVLTHLEEFCYAYRPLLAAVAGAPNVDMMATARNEGRREVWCLIRDKMHRAYVGAPVGGAA